jgi:PAS domain S-box-containing protein
MVKSGLRLLLIDDNPQDRQLVLRRLEQDYRLDRVIAPTNREEFERALSGDSFDLVITDYQIHWTTGLDVLRRIRRQFPRCPVIMFTATGNEEIAVEAMKHGLDDYIIKSVEHLIRLSAAVRRSLDQLATAERAESVQMRLANLLSSLTVGVFRCRSDGQLLETNESFRRLLNIPPDVDIQDRDLSSFFLDLGEAFDVASRLQDDRTVSKYETQFVCDDGSVVWVALQETLQRESDGSVVIDGIIEDISARRQSEEALRQTEVDVAHMARVAAMGELLAGIAHEVNQPLNAISNYSVACLKQLEVLPYPELEEVRKWIEQISEQAARTAAIIQGMRRFATRQKNDDARVELNRLLETTVDLLRFELRKYGARLEWDLVDPLPPVHCDPIQIQQVVVNLLQNALESMERTPVERRVIVVSSRGRGEEVEVSVADCGEGLDDSRPEKLYQPFVTSKPKGLGMGLPVSRTIIQTHGGRLWGENRQEGGAVFRFTLPCGRGKNE